jgi:hypothetical protein
VQSNDSASKIAQIDAHLVVICHYVVRIHKLSVENIGQQI